MNLELDQHINLKYLIAKEIYYTFIQHRYIAKRPPELKYDPSEEQKDKKVEHYYQGISLSTLDPISSALIECNSVISLSRFLEKFEIICLDEEIYRKEDPANKAIRRFINRFRDFHPNTRPVFWRIFLTQLCLYQLFKEIREDNTISFESHKVRDLLKQIIWKCKATKNEESKSIRRKG